MPTPFSKYFIYFQLVGIFFFIKSSNSLNSIQKFEFKGQKTTAF
jgi:hypothetical protein